MTDEKPSIEERIRAVLDAPPPEAHLPFVKTLASFADALTRVTGIQWLLRKSAKDMRLYVVQGGACQLLGIFTFEMLQALEPLNFASDVPAHVKAFQQQCAFLHVSEQGFILKNEIYGFEATDLYSTEALEKWLLSAIHKLTPAIVELSLIPFQGHT